MSFQFTELQEKWLKALESGEYQQGSCQLFDGSSYCCLGVACCVMGLQKGANCFFAEGYPFGGDLAFGTYRALGLRTPSGRFATPHNDCYSLIDMNDSGKYTFVAIAAYIRANPENVFESIPGNQPLPSC